MKSFEYGDEEFGSQEVVFAVSSMVIGFGVLTLPRTLAAATKSSDGWIALVVGGLIALAFGWLIGKLAERFPGKGFRDIVSSVANRSLGNALSFVFALYTLTFVGYETRGLAVIAKLYLFDRTPQEAICFFFMLVLAYGVSGPSIGLLRLNVMFLPLVLLIVFVVLALSTAEFNVHNLKPSFVTNWSDVLVSSRETVFSFLGFEVLLFYNTWNNTPRQTPKAIVAGLSIPFALYLLVFFFVIGIFGSAVAQNTLYPTAELAKQVEIPGGFFERFESLFFMIWVMTLFNTASMAFDVTIVALRELMPKLKRITAVVVLCPVVYLIAMQPQNVKEIDLFGEWISYSGLVIGWGMPTLLLLVAILRRKKGHERQA